MIEFAKVYFPNTYNDFNEASPGMMFIEMAAYVGDVLSYYIDSSFRESLLAYAEEKRNIYTIAQSFGYKPKVTSPASAVLDVFQSVPALNEKPDMRYALNVKAGSTVNIERSLKVGDRLEGHFVLGHIDGVATLTKIEKKPKEVKFWFRVPKKLVR